MKNLIRISSPAMALWLAFAGLASAALAQVDDESPVPKAFPSSHYEKLIQRSPFAPATPDVAQDVTPDFASSLYVSGIAKIGDKNCVFIRSRETQQTFALFSGEQGQDGISLLSIQWSPETGRSVVRIKKGSQEATVTFDQALIKTAVPTVVAAEPNQNAGALSPRAPGINRFNGGNTGGGDQTFGGRRRVRIINNE